MLYAPAIFGESLMDEWMNDFDREFSQMDREFNRNFGKKSPLFGKHAANLMKTDVRENEHEYELNVELPGFHKEDVELTLENGSDKPAMMLRLKAVHSRSGELVLPVFWSDNYTFLMPGESRELTVRVRKEDCPDKPALYVEGFNVKGRKI